MHCCMLMAIPYANLVHNNVEKVKTSLQVHPKNGSKTIRWWKETLINVILIESSGVSSDNQMFLNPNKAETLHISRKINPILMKISTGLKQPI